MTAQIRPNRMEVSDRFPMLGFSVRVDEPNVEAEVVLANDIALFSAENRARRTANNFYTSRENGTLMVPRGDGVFVVAPDVLERFVGSEKIYFGLATGHANNGGLAVDALPREGSPYVSLRGFTGRTLRRSGWARRQAVTPRLEWTGDAPRPGSESARPVGAPTQSVTNESNGVDLSTVGSGKTRNGTYDDGFGPLPEIPAREAAYSGGVTATARPSRMGLMLSNNTTARDALNWILRMVEQTAAGLGSDVSPPSLYELGDNSGTFVSAWQAVFGITAVINPANAFLAALPALARETGVTLSAGPALDTPVFGGGVGVVFDPNGQVALFGSGDINVDLEGLSEFASSLKAALQAKLKLGYNRGGIVGFSSLRKVASANVGEEVVGGAELWLDGSGSGIGGAVSIGVGFALQLAAEGAEPTIVRPSLPNSQRERATRIGGAFAGRIHEALDLGLEASSLDALLETLDPSLAARPMSATRGARRPLAQAKSVQRSINWDDVQLIPQPTRRSCWAAAAAMVIGWRDQVSLTPEWVAQICSRSINDGGPSPHAREAFASDIGLMTAPPQSYSVDGFYDLLATRGPLWVGKIMGGGTRGNHAIVVTGMYSDGDQHFVRIADPWDRVVGAPGAPGNYANTHSTGSRYIMRYEDFANEYELRIVGNPPTPQILHSGGVAGRIPNTDTTSAPAGYAMAAAPPRRARGSHSSVGRVRQMDAGAIATIAGTAVQLIAGNSGDISWRLPEWTAIKHPNDRAPAAEAEYKDAVVELDKWPRISGTFGLDDIYAWFRIRWQYNGTSLGRVYVQSRGNDDAFGWGLTVTGTIEDDSRLYPRSASATVAGPDDVPALHVVMHYLFDEVIADNHIATSRITLYADGTHEIASEWIQHARPARSTPREVARTV